MKTRSKRMPSYLDPNLHVFNHERHQVAHKVKRMHYTSAAVLTTTAGSRIYFLAGKLLLRARVSVQTAPSGGDLAADILIDGQSAFSSIDSKLKVESGQTMGRRAWFMGGRAVPEDSYVQCKIDTINSAGGPAVFEIEYIEAEWP